MNKLTQYKIIGQIEKEVDATIKYLKIDKDRAYKNVIGNITFNNRLRKIKIAAFIITLIGITSIIHYNINDDINELPVRNDILSITDNKGDIIIIDSLKEKAEIKIDGALVKNAQKQITYTPQNKLINLSVKNNTMNVPKGCIHTLTLSDGTVVKLNSQTVLKYPSVFNKNTRRITLCKGEIFVDVIHNTKPFIVNVDGVDIKVLGTQFNVNKYKNDQIIITLAKGQIKVMPDNIGELQFEPVDVMPLEQLSIDYINKKLSKKTVSLDSILDWMNEDIKFEHYSFERIVEELERWYDYQIVFNDEVVKNLSYSGQISKKKDLFEILDILTYFNEFVYEIKEKVVIIKSVKKE